MGTVGYVEQPEVSAARFDGEGYFKTGDKGEWRAGKRHGTGHLVARDEGNM